VVIQHEYGIFGGPDGAWITGFASELTRRGVPYLVTLHTVLSSPSASQAGTLYRLCRNAAAVTVFTETARRLAVGTGIAPPDRIVHVPHGAPPPGAGGEVRVEVERVLKRLEGKRLLSTFGLISPGKGLETAISALALVADRHPDVVYVIAGSTHPEVARQYGENYRDRLVRITQESGLEDRVVFLDMFLTDAEIAAVLDRTDIFCTPYRSREQISSGALTFAVAAGCAVVSTSYYYAEDMLADGAGLTVPPEDPEAYAAALDTLLADDERLQAARAAARTQGAALHWTAVARRFAGIARAAAARRPREVPSGIRADAAVAAHPEVPRLRLTHLNRITDAGGVVQSSHRTQPDLASGYCVDDVARLAIVAAGLCAVPVRELRGTDPLMWLDTGLDFMDQAYDRAAAASRNVRDVAGTWLDEPRRGDHTGRLLWSLGDIASSAAVPDKVRERAAGLLDEARAAVPDLIDLRSTAYALLGLVRMPEPTPELAMCTARLDTAWRRNAVDAWPWFEDVLAHDNARLAQALLAGGDRTGDAGAVGRALTALDWYLEQVGFGPEAEGEDSALILIGNTWRRKGFPRKAYEGDEQPVDATAVVEACVEAWRVTGNQRYADRARRAFSWFLGANRLRLPMYDAASGGCRDGLREYDVNPNEGAESALAYYQALLALKRAGLAW
jgi:glycosyltransferase involved in cell wall biosynthesis